MHPRNLQITTPTDITIVLTRDFNAPRHLVWEAMFTPDKMRQWMLPPPGWTITTCICDARIGGALHLVWKSPEADPVMTLHGVFTEVNPLGRITHTETMELGAKGSGQVIGSLTETHEFSEHNGITTMRITQVYASKDARDAAINSGMDQGMEAGYQKLDAVLAQIA